MPDIQIINDGVPTESTRVSMRGGDEMDFFDRCLLLLCGQ